MWREYYIFAHTRFHPISRRLRWSLCSEYLLVNCFISEPPGCCHCWWTVCPRGHRSLGTHFGVWYCRTVVFSTMAYNNFAAGVCTEAGNVHPCARLIPHNFKASASVIVQCILVGELFYLCIYFHSKGNTNGFTKVYLRPLVNLHNYSKWQPSTFEIKCLQRYILYAFRGPPWQIDTNVNMINTCTVYLNYTYQPQYLRHVDN